MSLQGPASTDLSRYPGFRSSKNGTPIHYPRRWQRDALIQAALAPSVSAMAPLDPSSWPLRTEFVFRVTIAATDFACVIGDTSQDHLRHPRLPILRLDRAVLLKEPLYSTARAVWSRKRLTVDPVIRYRVMEMASYDVAGVPAGEILARIDGTPMEPFDVLLAMLAQGHLIGQLGSGINRNTRIRPQAHFESKQDAVPRERLHSILTRP